MFFSGKPKITKTAGFVSTAFATLLSKTGPAQHDVVCLTLVRLTNRFESDFFAIFLHPEKRSPG
jgi:hypothetical protein